MPNKDFNFWAHIFNYLHQHSNAINSFFMAFFVAYFRICYVGKETGFRKKFAESALCGLLAVASESVFEYVNVPVKLAVALGAVIALYGVDRTRKMAESYLKHKGSKQ